MSILTHGSIFFFLLFSSIPSTSFSLSFNLPNISPHQNGRAINLSGEAYISSQGIQVTSDERDIEFQGARIGRATYFQPLYLWDKDSRTLTDFTTHFIFVISSNAGTSFGHGLTFFLAPLGSTIKPEWSGEGGLGIGFSNGSAQINSSLTSFVAVEFDTYLDYYDVNVSVPHVGIDINSMRSVATATWPNNITLGPRNDAWISYNASTKTLSVDFTGFLGNRALTNSLSYEVDLRDYLPEYVMFGFTASTNSYEKHNVKSWEFSSTLELKVTPQEITPAPGPAPGISSTGGEENRTGRVVGLSVGLVVVVLGVALASYCVWKKKCKKGLGDDISPSDSFMEIDFESERGPKKFPYSELVLATKSFAEEEKLGEGGFGGVYRGFLRETNSYIAVKRVSKGSKQGLKEYASEVRIISQLRHRNLVQLIGWCHERGELLLVYEFMPNGSLDSHLFRSKSVLNWDVRYKIAQGLASALLYLHEEWESCVVHRDIKSSNIMLDSNFNAKLGDFGLARLVDHEKGSRTTALAGTMGYMAPECVITGRASKETDVYSFGIVLLEIACGRRPIDKRSQNKTQIVLVEWVWSLYGTGKLIDALDPNLSIEFDKQVEVERLMIVGLWCVHPDSNHRPSIRKAIHVLNFEADLPILPSTLPVATYFSPQTSVVDDSSTSDMYSGGVIDSN